MTRRDRALQRALKRLEHPDCRTLAMELGVLLPLPLWQEDDLYALLESDVRRLAGLSGPVDFAALRCQARGKNLAEQYDDLSARVIGANLRPLMAREQALRMGLPVVMQDAQALLQLARRMGKQTILWAPWPSVLTDAQVRQMLTDRGLPQPDEVCVEHWSAAMQADTTLVLAARRRRGEHRLTVPSPMAEDGLHAPHEAMRYLGFRTMRAVAALHPSLPDADPEAYGAFGMYLLSNALWLTEEVCRGGFERMNFLARDGCYVRQAFETVRDALHLPVDTAYVRISRQAAFPLHFRRAADLLSLPLLTDLSAHTPQTLLNLFAPVVDLPRAVSTLRQCGFEPKRRLSEEDARRFIEIFRERIYDQARFDAYREHARQYLAPLFTGKCAVYDVGYNLRSETLIQALTGADVTAFITHTDSDLADRRQLAYRTLYGQTPCVSWVAREQFLLEDAPACLMYDAKGPVLAAEKPALCPAVAAFQRQGMAFVRDMAAIFGERLCELHLRPADGCAPFERFLQTASRERTEDFRAARVENAFLEGAAPADDTVLQWRLMQTDASAGPAPVRRLRRAWRRLLHSPKDLLRKIGARFTPKT